MRRRGIEIYFVLYLAALMLLLSDSPKRESDLASTVLRNLFASTFTLIAEKPTLLCRAVLSSDTLTFLHFDSTNTIIPTGLVDSIRYRIIVEDQGSNQQTTLPIGSTTQLGHVSFTIEQVGQALRLRWGLDSAELNPRLFRIRIEATALPQLPPSLTGEQRDQLRALLSTHDRHLTSGISLTVGYLPQRQSSQQPSPQPVDTALVARLETLVAQRTSASELGNFALVPEHSTIGTLPSVQWENRIAIYGASPLRDIAGPPQVSGIPSAFVTIEGNSIVVRSLSSTPSTANVRVTLRRRDGAEASASFTVITHALQQPIVPTVMYPGVEYRYVPNLANLSGIDARALLRDDLNLIRASSSGEPFVFTPSLSDTARTFYFERYAGKERIGQVIAIECEMFPAPEIISVQRDGDRSMLIICRAYGLASDERSRVRIEVDPPNAARVQELYGNSSYSEELHARIQQFRLMLTGSAIPKIAAVNGYQRRSSWRELPQ
jgi:hypothetical protein